MIQAKMSSFFWLYPALVALILVSLAAFRVYMELGLHPIFWMMLFVLALLPVTLFLARRVDKNRRQVTRRRKHFLSDRETSI